MERAGFEVRDVESLREHYARTLRAWVANLEANWDEAVRLVGEARARVWRLYMSGSVVGFTDGGIAVHQVLGVVPTLGWCERHAGDEPGLGVACGVTAAGAVVTSRGSPPPQPNRGTHRGG